MAQSLWIGGHTAAVEVGGGERVPYWLNGMVPLHTLLANADPTGAAPETAATGASTARYIDHILSQQDPATGWLGPNVTVGDVFW